MVVKRSADGCSVFQCGLSLRDNMAVRYNDIQCRYGVDTFTL